MRQFGRFRISVAFQLLQVRGVAHVVLAFRRDLLKIPRRQTLTRRVTVTFWLAILHLDKQAVELFHFGDPSLVLFARCFACLLFGIDLSLLASLPNNVVDS